MIKYNPKLWFSHIFKLYKSDTLKILLPEIILISIYTWAINFILIKFFPEFNLKVFKNAFSIHTLLGFVMGLLLVFRTNTAYDRWWEGRKHWGALVNNTRYAAIKAQSLLPRNNETKDFIELIAAFPYSLKNHLRDIHTYEDLEISSEFKVTLKNYNHIPNGLISLMYQKLNTWKKNKTISDIDLLLFDKEIKNFIDILGACERIKNTPIPFSHTLFIKKFIFIYVLTIPFGFIPDFGYWSIPIGSFVFYVFVSIEIIAEEIEDPFGLDDNDLPLDELSDKIKTNIKEIEA
jgi:ion channel-forming bestrophin family protein